LPDIVEFHHKERPITIPSIIKGKLILLSQANIWLVGGCQRGGESDRALNQYRAFLRIIELTHLEMSLSGGVFNKTKFTSKLSTIRSYPTSKSCYRKL
jgi:hypothetical protein